MDPARWREIPQEGQKLEKEKHPLEGEGLAPKGLSYHPWPPKLKISPCKV